MLRYAYRLHTLLGKRLYNSDKLARVGSACNHSYLRVAKDDFVLYIVCVFVIYVTTAYPRVHLLPWSCGNIDGRELGNDESIYHYFISCLASMLFIWHRTNARTGDKNGQSALSVGTRSPRK